jgi:DNA-binding response OmpR family regulator
MLTNNEVDEGEYAEIIRAGVDDYFLKPVSFNRILVHLEKALRRSDC